MSQIQASTVGHCSRWEGDVNTWRGGGYRLQPVSASVNIFWCFQPFYKFVQHYRPWKTIILVSYKCFRWHTASIFRTDEYTKQAVVNCMQLAWLSTVSEDRDSQSILLRHKLCPDYMATSNPLHSYQWEDLKSNTVTYCSFSSDVPHLLNYKTYP